MQIYENGVALATTPNPSPTAGVLSEQAYSLAGADYFTTNQMTALIGDYSSTFWTGQLDEFCMWSRQLTPVEIQQMYAAGNPGQ